MGLVSQYWIEKSLDKLEGLKESAEDPGISEYVEALQHYSYQEGEIVELEDNERYVISGRRPGLTFTRNKETYEGQRIINLDGTKTTSYSQHTFTEDDII